MIEHDGVEVAPRKKDKPELKLPSSIDPAIAEQLVEQARTDGVDLVGQGGLLGELTVGRRSPRSPTGSWMT